MSEVRFDDEQNFVMGGNVEFGGLFDGERTASEAVDDPRLMPNRPSAVVVNTPSRVSLKDFELLEVVGEGAFGKVFQTRKKTGSDAGTVYAVKVLRKDKIVQKVADIALANSERIILETIKSPFLCELFYSFQTDGRLYLVLEYCSGGDFFSFMEDHQKLEEEHAKLYIAEIVIALEHLHDQDIIYRDLKLENILLEHTGHLKLTDFNLCKKLDGRGETRTFCGTAEYMAPEICRRENYGKEVDWWALGVLFYDMVSGNNPFKIDTTDNWTIMQNVINNSVKPPASLSRGGKSLLKGLMTKDKRARLGAGPAGANEIKTHKFFKKFDWDRAYARQLVMPFTPRTSILNPKSTREPLVESFCMGVGNIRGENPFSGFSYIAPSVLENANGNNSDAQKDSSSTRSDSINDFKADHPSSSCHNN